MIGRTISHYHITEKLGEGGMGVVYKAQDTKLDRSVALKFLSTSALPTDDGKARFVREAKAAASLSHPNICTIHEIDETNDGQAFIAMEYVEGQTLSERIKRGPLKLQEAITIATQVAEGLQAAHEQGIVHRDVKSSNVMLTERGGVKVMDFGLAKTDAATMLTKEGTALGTVAYMSPEQTRGEAVDHRSDIWSLGVVLYEMISGQRPFKGNYEQAVVYSILNEDPEPLTALRSGLPIVLDGIIAKALAKERDIRYQNVEELPADLKALDSISLSKNRISTRPVIGSIVTTGTRPKPLLAWAMAFIAGVLLTSLAFWFWPRPSQPEPDGTPGPVARFPLGLEDGIELALVQPPGVHLALSPDGESVAYIGRGEDGRHLYMRALDEVVGKRVPGTNGAQQPFFSPDGRWVGFAARGQIFKTPVVGGAPVPLTEVSMLIGASWGSDGRIVFGELSSGLKAVREDGGEVETVTALDRDSEDSWHIFPQVLPDGEHVIYTVVGGRRRIEVAALDGSDTRVLREGSDAARYADGYLFFPTAGGLMAQPFDLTRLELTGSPELVLDSVYTKSSLGANNATFDVSITGSLAYQPGASREHLAWVAASGEQEALSETRWGYWYATVSPSSDVVAVTIAVSAADKDIWVLGSGVPMRLTRDHQSLGAVWSPNGDRIAYNSFTATGHEIHVKSLDPDAPAELLLKQPGTQWPESWSPDGRTLAFSEEHPESGSDIWLLSVDGDRTVEPWLRTPSDEAQPKFSPDGRWMAYTSNRSGKDEIWVSRIDGGGTTQASLDGGLGARWSRDGLHLYYVEEDRIVELEVRLDPAFHVTNRRVVLEGPQFFLGDESRGTHYDVAPDGRLIVSIVEDMPQGPIIVLNWLEELKQRMGN